MSSLEGQLVVHHVTAVCLYIVHYTHLLTSTLQCNAIASERYERDFSWVAL